MPGPGQTQPAKKIELNFPVCTNYRYPRKFKQAATRFIRPQKILLNKESKMPHILRIYTLSMSGGDRTIL